MGHKAKAPDPVATSTAQEHANQTNTANPFLSTAYSQTGTNADGTPIEQATSKLSPQLQALYSNVGGYNSGLDPANLSSEFGQTQRAAYDRQESYMQPQYDLQNKQLTDQLAQQGISASSDPDGYAAAMQLQSNQQNFAKQQAYDSSFSNGLNAEGQLFTQGVNASNLPISQLSTLYSLGSGQGLGNSTTLSQLAQSKYQSQLASQNNADSGLASLVGSGVMYAALAA